MMPQSLHRQFASHSAAGPLAEGQASLQDLYWQRIPQWQHIDTGKFLSYTWQVSQSFWLNAPYFTYRKDGQLNPQPRPAHQLYELSLAARDPASQHRRRFCCSSSFNVVVH